MERKDIPVTVIGGYLGAGKTTALNGILAGDHGVRLAVLVNDFGAVNIDAALIATHNDDTIALTNGCVCCSIADDLGTALKAQVARPDPPDHIMIEASGVADPAKIGRFSDGWPGCWLAQITVLADVATIRTRAIDKFVGGLVQRQLQAADRIVLNKGDLVSSDQAAQTASWVSSVAPGVPVDQTTGGELGPDPLVWAPAADRRRSALLPAGNDDATAIEKMRSFVWRPTRPVRLQALEDFLASQPQIHRAKGTVVSAARPSAREARLLFNWSGGRADTCLAEGSDVGDALVVIGIFNQEEEQPFAVSLDRTLDNIQG